MIVPLTMLAVFAVTVLSCLGDIREMRIPNWHSGAVAAAFAVAFILSPGAFGPWWHYVGAFALVFAATFGMYCAGMFGAGDTKLGSVLALWVGMQGLLPYLFYMALAGGVLGGLSLWMRHRKPFANPPPKSWMARAQAGENVVPYGIAISMGAWLAILHTPAFHQGMDELFKTIH